MESIKTSPPDPPSASAPVSSQPSALSEVIVTAQRRAERVERTPVAVAVVSAAALAKQAVISEEDLRTATPGLSVRESLNSNQLNYAIRGQSVDAFSDNRPGVLPYFNEVQVGGSGGASGFYDLSSVQVLKGPQGTLFGREATGGAVLFTSQRPVDNFSGYVSAAGGDYSHQKYEGALNVPLVQDVLLARISAFYESRDGFQYNTYNDSTVGGFNRYGLRGSVDLTEGPFKNQLTVDYSRYSGQNTAAVIGALVPGATVPANTLYAGGATTDAAFTGLFLAEGAPAGTNLTGAWAAFIATHPRANPNGIGAAFATQQANGPFRIDEDGANRFDSNTTVISNVTTYDLGGSAQIKNVFGYVSLGYHSNTDIDGSPYEIDQQTAAVAYHAYSEELQFLGKTLGGDLNYVAGAYYSYEDSTNFLPDAVLQLPPYVVSSPQIIDYNAYDTTIAVYAQGTYDLGDLTRIRGLSATVGLRYTNEKVESDMLPPDTSYAAASSRLEANNQHTTSDNLSWTFGLQYQLDPNLFLYVASRRSFKAAGFNGTIAPYIGLGSAGGNGFAQEQLTDGEIGAKFKGNLGAWPARLNLAVYKDWLENDQRVDYTIAYGGLAAISVNVPASEVTGVELDGVVNPTSWLDVGASVAYTDGEFTNNVVRVQGSPTVFGSYPDSPRWIETVFAQVTEPIVKDLDLTLRGEMYSQAKAFYSSTANLNPTAVLPGYTIANFTLGVQDRSKGFSLSINLKNAFDHTYYVGGIAVGTFLGFNTLIPAAPRTILVEVRKTF